MVVMQGGWRWLWRGVALLVLLGLMAAAAMAVLLMSLPQGAALVPQAPVTRPAESLREVRGLMHRGLLFKTLHGEPLVLNLPLADLASVAQDAAGRVAQGRARLRADEQVLWLEGSVPVRATPLASLSALGEWLNVAVGLRWREQGAPELAQVKVGRVGVPPALALWVARQALARHELLEPAELLVAAVAQAQVADEQLLLTLHWTPELQGQTVALVVPAEDWPRLVAYHRVVVQALSRVPPAMRYRPGMPLPELMRAVFVHAQQRTLATSLMPAASEALSAQDVAARENRAALVAVALAANRLSLHQLLPRSVAGVLPVLPPVSVQLLAREDFAQHYTLSTLLSLMVGGRVADTVGLYKEMADADKGLGGSGFSFNDLVMNRAGIRLGQRARQDPVALLHRLGGEAALLSDRDFVPQVDGLPEFLNRPEFIRRFGGLNDARFRQVLDAMDQTLAGLPVLR